jgi:predicted RNase H-like nuclease
VVGVDGIRGGWVAAEISPDGHAAWTVVETFDRLLAGCDGRVAVVAVDIPIGLTDGPPRECDRAARRALPGRSSTVFSAPTRATVTDHVSGLSHAQAVRQARSRGHPAPSAQAWNIVAKIADVDAAVRAATTVDVVECHPEVSFTRLAGRVLGRKTTTGGIGERLMALRGFLDAPAALAEVPTAVPLVDALDALACAWTARRVQAGTADRLGDPAQRDAERSLLIWV